MMPVVMMNSNSDDTKNEVNNDNAVSAALADNEGGDDQNFGKTQDANEIIQ